MRYALTLVTSIFLAGAATIATASPEIPGAPQSHPIALVGATVHPVSGPPIERATLIFTDGRIAAVGRDVEIPADAQRIDVAGKHLYPGLIDANTQLGLIEVPTIRGSVDQAETGEINPNVKAQVAFNPDSESIPVSRSGGVLAVLTLPTGGLIAGTSACMVLDGWTWEDMCLKPAVGMHVNWPPSGPLEEWWTDRTGLSASQDRDQAINTIRRNFDEARAYWNAVKAHAAGEAPAPEHDVRHEAMIPVFERKVPLFADADDVNQIESAVAFAAEQNVRLVIVGGYDASKCAALLKKHDVAVVIDGVYRVPQRTMDPYDSAYNLPARLHEAGIKFCIAGVIDGAAGLLPANLRNLPFVAGTAAAHGLPPDEALKSVTLYPAQILGVADRIGSLDVGKDATLIITTGDPLEISTQITGAYIGGRKVDMLDRHKRLWEKYKEKYRRMGIENDKS